MKVEYYALENIVDYMDANGLSSNLVHFSLDQSVVDEINEKHKLKLNIKDIEKAIDVCRAQEWLKSNALGVGKYKELKISTTGVAL
ncbi:hypothetical protein [Serratia bockelmannii]|uniref:hypothetical protein n=1 Tax=Serratia bockelmannii TaxID=2703793 RepID=UPI0018D6197D|nr:hypothetical protein [Serratia marcescens]